MHNDLDSFTDMLAKRGRFRRGFPTSTHLKGVPGFWHFRTFKWLAVQCSRLLQILLLRNEHAVSALENKLRQLWIFKWHVLLSKWQKDWPFSTSTLFCHPTMTIKNKQTNTYALKMHWKCSFTADLQTACLVFQSWSKYLRRPKQTKIFGRIYIVSERHADHL